ncbi:copper transport protein ctr1 [Sarracenia purpurea var. burkii]
MEMPGRRSNYTLLSQVADDQYHQPPPPQRFSTVVGGAGSYYESLSGDKTKSKSDRSSDWVLIDHRMAQQPGRIGSGFPSSIGLQRQSSGSSFGGSSVSGEYYMPWVATTDPDGFGHLHDDVFKVGGGGGGEFRSKAAETGGVGSSSKSWAQQTEESYQLQLALALRLSSEATCADDPNFLDPVQDESASRLLASINSAESMSHRFWVNGCLSYFDRIPDGFYLIHGMDPYLWTICNDVQENSRIPSIESLKAIDPRTDSSIEVILIDRHSDPRLKELQNKINSVSCSCNTAELVIDQLAKIICNCMGGAASMGEDGFVPFWKECSDGLKEFLGSVVLPIGSLSVGLCRHRALLFKVLADTIDLPCRVAKGCKHCTTDDAASCLVRFGLDREYLVDLIGKPGSLCEPDSLLNGPSSISISSPLCFPRFRQVESPVNFRSLAKQYFSECESINIVFDDFSTGSLFSLCIIYVHNW